MEIIPVVDLKGGVVVHARRGLRHSYAPIVSQLCRSAEPGEVITAIIERYAPRTVYVADLEAIEGSGDHRQLVCELSARYAHLTFWLDAGFSASGDMIPLAERPNIVPVIGSESMMSMHSFLTLRQQVPEFILSLDFFGGEFRGPRELLERPDSWPERLIHLNLDRVGAMKGPDIAGCRQMLAAAPAKRIYVGGGIRHAGDVRDIADLGASGVLLASALHDGSFESTHIAALKETGTR